VRLDATPEPVRVEQRQRRLERAEADLRGQDEEGGPGDGALLLGRGRRGGASSGRRVLLASLEGRARRIALASVAAHARHVPRTSGTSPRPMTAIDSRWANASK